MLFNPRVFGFPTFNAKEHQIGGGLPLAWTWDYNRRAQQERERERAQKEQEQQRLQEQEALAAEAERIAKQEREQRERTGRLDVARARTILARTQRERENAQTEVDRLQSEIAAFYQDKEREEVAHNERVKAYEKRQILLAEEAQALYNAAQKKELEDVLMIFMMTA